VKRTTRTFERRLNASTRTDATPNRIVVWARCAAMRDAGPDFQILTLADHDRDHLSNARVELGRLLGGEGRHHAASFCSMGVASYADMKSMIRRAVFRVSDRSALRFVIRLASPIDRRPNVEGFSPCFEQNRSIWARMSASLASVVTIHAV
jgi:hypothetical protein